jgi:signal transduction histidine kinase
MSRAEARRRTKETQRAELAAEQGLTEDELDGAEPIPTGPQERKPLFKMPDILGDLRSLPSSFREKPILFLPALLFLVGLVIFEALPGLSTDIQSIAGYYIQFFFAPPALFTFFIAGFFAPRAAYLVGFFYGLFAAVLWSIALLTLGTTTTNPAAEPVSSDMLPLVLNMLVIGVLYGTFAAALASWYRGFLKGIQERGNERRAQKEIDERAKRAAERQEARKLAKQRPTT